MVKKEALAILTDDELIKYANEVKEVALMEINNVQFEHGFINGVTNSHGVGREYMNSDLLSYYKSFKSIIRKYVLPIECEVKKRISGNEELLSVSHQRVYKGFNLERLEYFCENISNSYIGRLVPMRTNPNWYVHLKQIKRFYNQEDYQDKLKKDNRHDKLNSILDK